MSDFESINNSLNSTEPSTVKVALVTLSGVQTKEVEAGISVATFKARYGLEGKKIVDEDGDTLQANDVITGDTQLFISTPKQNG